MAQRRLREDALQASSTIPVSQQPAGAWTRFFLPSVSDLLFIALLFSLSCGSFAGRLLGDADIGWHIRNGEQILLTHAVTRTDSFSSTMSGRPWYAWEWLYDAAIAAIHHVAGLNGVVFFAALVVALPFTLVFRMILARGGDLLTTVLLLALSMGAAAIHLFARPHVLSWLFAIVWFALLDSWDASDGIDSDRQSRRLLWLPPLMMLWVNVHGGFLTGFILLPLYLASSLICYVSAPADEKPAWLRKLRWLASITGLALLATLVNPYGYKLHVHIYEYLSDRFLMNHIQEFASPNFHGAAEKCFAALLLITILVLASAQERPRISRLLVIVFAVGSGLYASRNIPVSSLLLTVLISPPLSRSLAAAGNRAQRSSAWRRFFSRWSSLGERMTSVQNSLTGHFWPGVTLAAGILLCLHGGRFGSAQIMDAQFPAKRFPVQSVNSITQHGIRDPVFCPDYWGGYVIYRLYPQNQVVVDDRHDLYGATFLKQYLKTEKGEPGWNELLDDKQVTVVLEPAGSPLANLLALTPGWKVAYEDNVGILFLRPRAGR